MKRATLLAVALGLFSASVAQRVSTPIEIGIAVAQTSNVALLGQEQVIGARLAEKVINRGSPRLEVQRQGVRERAVEVEDQRGHAGATIPPRVWTTAAAGKPKHDGRDAAGDLARFERTGAPTRTAQGR